MPRKKKETVLMSETNGVAVMDAPDPEKPAIAETPIEAPTPEPVAKPTEPPPLPPPKNGGRKPDFVHQLQVDKTTYVEIALWLNTYTDHRTNETYEQVTTAIKRFYLDATSNWREANFFRTHDLGPLSFLIAKAAAFAYERRMKSDPPF